MQFYKLYFMCYVICFNFKRPRDLCNSKINFIQNKICLNMFEYLGLKTLQLKEPYDFEVE